MNMMLECDIEVFWLSLFLANPGKSMCAFSHEIRIGRVARGLQAKNPLLLS